MITELIEMQEGNRKRPFKCRVGFHRFFQVRSLITTGDAICCRCGAGLMTSLFGDFDLSRRESVALLREYAASAIEASGEDRNGLHAKHESAVAKPDAQNTVPSHTSRKL